MRGEADVHGHKSGPRQFGDPRIPLLANIVNLWQNMIGSAAKGNAATDSFPDVPAQQPRLPWTVIFRGDLSYPLHAEGMAPRDSAPPTRWSMVARRIFRPNLRREFVDCTQCLGSLLRQVFLGYTHYVASP